MPLLLADRLASLGFDAARIDEIAALRDPVAFLPYARLLDRDRGVIPFEPWPHIADLLRLWDSERRTVILKSRQLGVSWTLALYALWTAMFRPGANVLMLSAGEREAAALLAKCKEIQQQLPAWLRLPVGKNNDSALTFPGVNSQIIALPSTRDAGRGEQATLTILDEFAFHEYAAESLSALLPTVGDSGRLIVVSTANGQGGAFYDLWAHADERRYRAHFVGWSARPDRDDAWLAARRSELGALLEQEYPSTPVEAFLQSGAAVFAHGVERTDWLRSVPTPPEWPPETLVYRLPRPGLAYLLGVDVAEGLAHGDRSCAVVLERDALGRCVEAAHLCGAYPTDTWAEHVDTLAAAYGALCGVERNSIGHAVVDHLRRFQADRVRRRERVPYRLYAEQAPLKSPTSVGAMARTGEFGWRTDAASKPVMIQELEEALRGGLVRLGTEALVRELRAYQRDEKGKTNAPAGQHDDRVIALAIAWQMRKWHVGEAKPLPTVRMAS